MTRNISPLKAGIIFGAIMVVFTAIYQLYEGAEFGLPLLLSSLAGGFVGGLVYGGIEWLKRRNS